MLLFHQDLGSGTPMMILHGLFGSLDNWRTLSLKLAEHFRVLPTDLRNHGHSFHSDEHTYELMAEDINALYNHLNLPPMILVGHSMGGKAAMFFALKYSEKVKKLVVADMSPKQYPPHHNIVLQALNAVEMDKVTSRKEVEDQLSVYISDSPTRQFLMKGLVRNDDGTFKWRFNLRTLTGDYNRINVALPDGQYHGPTLFMAGERSNYIQKDDHTLILHHFPQAQIQVIPNAGHWIHAEQPQAFLEALLAFVV
jgi:pimeloyl-ACP methyl ester carboxylesterase